MFVAQGALAGNWTGFYIGAHVGGAFGDVDWTNVSDTTNLNYTTGDTLNHSPDGVLGGAQLGFDWQVANWVFGVEVAGSGLDFDETLPSPLGPAEELSAVDIQWALTAAARVGIAWENSLFYVKGGYAGAEIETLNSDYTGPVTVVTTEETHNGFVVGAGIEHQVGENVSVGLEYNYLDFGNQDHSGVGTPGGEGLVNDVDAQLHTVTARLNYHFNPF
jgi:outer membrane immunogenic protein